MHQFRKSTLWHLIICYFHSSGMICRRDIQAESTSSNPDVSRFSPDSLRSGNHRKSLEVPVFICTWRLTWKLRIKVLLDAQMHVTALEYVALAGSSKTVPQCTPRSGPEAGQRAGSGEVISRLTKHPWPARSPDLSPLDLVLERGHDRAQKKTPHNHHAGWAEGNHRVLRPVNRRWSQTGGIGYPQTSSRLPGA